MARDPVRDAFVPLAGDQAIDDMSQAIEQYRPLVVLSANDITTRDLSRTKSVIWISGSAYRVYKQDQSNIDAEDGETVILDAADNPFVLVSRADRYDLPIGTTGLLGDGEELPAIALPVALTFPANLPGSYAAVAGDAPTGNVTITYEKSTDHGTTWADAFSVTFLAGERQGSFTLASDLTTAAYTLLRPKGPATADATFAGFSGTIVATI